jgi:hypothetical protein
MKQDREGTNWTQCPCIMVLKAIEFNTGYVATHNIQPTYLMRHQASFKILEYNH